MAESRPFSTQYKGQSISPVPSGYIEAYSRIGQGMAEMGKQVGEDVNKIFESYKKNADENEAIDAAWKSSNATYGSFIATAYGENSTQMQQFKEDVAAFPSLSLSQRKAKYATYNALAENAKSQLVAEEIGANRTRAGIQAAGAAQGPSYEAALANQTMTVNNVTMRTSSEVDAMDRKLTVEFQKAKEGGYDLRPHMEARAKFEAAKAKLLAQGYRTNNTLSAAALIADEAEKKAESENKTTATTADAVAEAASPTAVTKKKVPVVKGSTDKNLIGGSILAEMKRALARTDQRRLTGRNTPAYNRFIDEASALYDKGELSPEVLTSLIEKTSADAERAQAIADKYKVEKEKISTNLGMEAVNTAEKRALFDSKLSELKKQLDPDGWFENYVGGFWHEGEGLRLILPEGKFTDAKAAFESSLQKAVERLGGGFEEVEVKPTESGAAKTPESSAAKTPQKIRLSDAVKRATETLQTGNEFEVMFNAEGEVDPLLRAVIFHNPEVKKPDGTIDMTLAAQVISQTLAARVDVESDRLVVKPVEIEPITYQQIDLNSARNAEDAARIAMRNGVIKELQARGIPATADNIALATTGKLVDEETGTEYTPEYSSGGVLRGKPIKPETGMSPLDAVKYQRETLGLEKDAIEQQSRELGRRIVNPSTGKNEIVPIQFSDTLAKISPLDNPSVAGVAPKEDMDKYKKRFSDNTKLIEIVRDSVPSALKKLGQDQHGNEFHYVDRNGKINGAALNGDEQAKKEYIRVLFGSVRELGQGLGALSQSDYYFVFTQAGIPVSYESIMSGKGDIIEKAVTYMTAAYAQSGPNYYNNALDGLVAGAKANMTRIQKESNNSVRVTFPTRSSAPNGGLKPFAAVRDELIPILDKMETGQDRQVALYFAIMNAPEKFVSADGRFRTRAEALEYAVNNVAQLSGYAPEHIFDARFRPKQTK